MSLRRGFLIAMLIALALCAAMGVLVVFTGSGELMARILGTAIATAVASAVLLGLSFLVAWPKLRLGTLMGMGVVLFCWLLILGMIWAERPWVGGGYRLQQSFAGTMGFTLFMGLPCATALCFGSFRWAKVAIRVFVIGAVLAFFICEVGVLLEFLEFGYPVEEWPLEVGLLTYGLTVVIAALAINAGCGDKRYFRWPGAGLAVAGWALAAEAVVATREDNRWFLVGMGAAWITAIALAHTNLILMARLRRWQVPVQLATMALAWLCGLFAVIGLAEASGLSGSTVGTPNATEMLMRACAGTGIMAGCGSLALVVLSIFNIMLKSQRAEVGEKGPAAMQAMAMEVVCPRCQERQTLAFGDSACKRCDLRFTIKVTEPRCPACGYLLYQLTSARCPECGAELGNGQTGTVVGPAFPVQPDAAPIETLSD